jgi:hypothetical protein
MVEQSNHTLIDIQGMYYNDFLLYNQLIYNRKMERLKRQEAELKKQ